MYIPLMMGESFLIISQIMTSFKRIENFLDADEVKHLDQKEAIMGLSDEVILNKAFLRDEQSQDIQKNGNDYKQTNFRKVPKNVDEALTLTGFSSSWGDNFSLVDINLRVKKGELIAVVGPVACGKTTLLMSLLQELDHSGLIIDQH